MTPKPCGCDHATSSGTTVLTVADVARDPRAKDVLTQLGIDDCCSAHLTLAEASAAAGVSPAELMRRLELAVAQPGPVRITLDVRGLPPPLPLMRVLERLETLVVGEQLELVHDRRPMLLYPQLEVRGFVHETNETEPGVVRVLIARKADA
jgi:tRNA 2-thiouridine synthesizing protein A